MRQPIVVALLGVMTAVLVGIAAFAVVPRWLAPATVDVPKEDVADTTEATGRIRASLFYVAEDGLHLTPVDADVPYGASPSEQVRALVEAQLQPAPPPLAQAVAEGTKVRQIFVTEDGTAFVDLSKEAVSNHRGGSLDELFAVYAIVNAITVNLPAIKGVQILIDGQEVETLAGHVDLRHPLSRNLRWAAASTSEAQAPASSGTPDAPPTPQEGAKQTTPPPPRP
jgi:hypothetical protein